MATLLQAAGGTPCANADQVEVAPADDPDNPNALSTGLLFDSGTPGTLVTNAVDQPVIAPSEPLPNPCAL